MRSAPLPDNERERLYALERYAILDTAPEMAFDELTELASSLCETPMALISLIDGTRQWFKASVGLPVRETPRELAFCAHAILREGVFVVPDSHEDARFEDNPLVTDEPHIRFYAGAPLTTSDGFRLGTLCVLDRTPRMLTAQQQRMLATLAHQVVVQMELRRHLAETEAAEERLRANVRELDRLKSEFVATVSHELRTPLTSIVGSLGLLASGVTGTLSDEARQLVALAERNSIRLIALINDILDFEKLESGRMELDARAMPLARILEHAVEAVTPAAIQEGIIIRVQADATVVEGDEARLTQAVVNLVANAVKYSPRGSVVTVAGSCTSGCAEVRVRDEGRGIAPPLQPRLFRRFQQLESGDARTKGGAGIGLAICKAIVEQHGGTVGVESREGEGSTFWLRLPVLAPVAVQRGLPVS
jgi:signal transduction histidine kinase